MLLDMCQWAETCSLLMYSGEGKTAAGYWGDFKCDTPLWTLENLLETLANRSTEVNTTHNVN